MKEYIQTSEEQQREAKLMTIEIDRFVALAELALMEGNPKEALSMLNKAESRLQAARIFCRMAISPFGEEGNVVKIGQAKTLPD